MVGVQTKTHFIIFVANRDWIICEFAVKLSTCNESSA